MSIYLSALPVLHRLSRGSFGEVFLCRGADGLPPLVAVKRLAPEWGGDETRRMSLHRERTLGSTLSHPNIVRSYDPNSVFPSESPTPLVVMEYVDGLSLESLLRGHVGGIDLPFALHLGLQMLRGLDYLHREAVEGRAMVHGDIKPSNLLLSRGGSLKIGDFGNAQLSDEQLPPALRGTLRYMAPEQAIGDPLSPATDQFSAALVLGEMVLGRPLYKGRDSQTLLTRVRAAQPLASLDEIAEINPALGALLRRALARDPGKRFPSAGAMAEAVAALALRFPLEDGAGGKVVARVLDATLSLDEPISEVPKAGPAKAMPRSVEIAPGLLRLGADAFGGRGLGDGHIHQWASGALPRQRHVDGHFDLEAFMSAQTLELLDIDPTLSGASAAPEAPSAPKGDVVEGEANGRARDSAQATGHSSELGALLGPIDVPPTPYRRPFSRLVGVFGGLGLS